GHSLRGERADRHGRRRSSEPGLLQQVTRARKRDTKRRQRLRWRFDRHGSEMMAGRKLRIPVAIALLAWSSASWALDADEARRRARTTLAFVESEVVRGGPPPRPRYVPPTPAERVAAGELLLRARDYDRAIETLEKVLELHRQGKAVEAAYAD